MALNSAITYDKKRRDITFCTMLFKLPDAGNLDALKRMDRKFEDFYLPSLRKMVETFERVALWCDEQTAQYLRDCGLSKKISMRVMKFSDLPHYSERDAWLKILESMRGNVGFLLRHKTPIQWLNYMTLIAAKPAVIEWAAAHNKYKSDYFMWIDAGAFNEMYSGIWRDWGGAIAAKPKRARIAIAPTLGRSRPHFVPRFVYDIYRWVKGPIPDATAQSLARQDLTDIAMINADYDVPAGAFIVPTKRAREFYDTFERVRRIMIRHGLVSTEQAVFQAMMKFDVDGLFELSYIRGYEGLYAAVAAKNADYLL